MKKEMRYNLSERDPERNKSKSLAAHNQKRQLREKSKKLKKVQYDVTLDYEEFYE